MGVFGCKKMRLRTIRSKNGHHFLPPTISKIGELDTGFIRISQPGEFWANSKNREFLDHFCRFPIIKPQNQRPKVLMIRMCPKPLKIGI